MNALHFLRVVKRTLNETWIDLRSRDFGKVSHLLISLSKHFLLGYPYNVTIEPVNECNLRCEFCSSPPALIKREKKAMQFEEFKKIVDDLQHVTHYLWLFLVGEPFLNPGLNKMIAYANSKNFHTVTSTNAMLLNREKARELVASGLDHLIISLDGASKDTFEAMRKGAKFEKVIENIQLIDEEKKRQHSLKPFVELQLIVSKINENELQQFKHLGEQLGANKCTFKSLAVAEWVYSKEKAQQIREKFLPTHGKSRYSEDFKLKEERFCDFDKRSVILVNGNVCMCCYDIDGAYCFGNALEKPFIEIWNSSKYKSSRKLMHDRALPLCKVCAKITDL